MKSGAAGHPEKAEGPIIMDKQALTEALDGHITGTRLDLPSAALNSDPARQQLDLWLAGANLVIDPIQDRQSDGSSETIIGTGGNAVFGGMTVTARFIAGEPVALSLAAEAQPGWTLAGSFPRLEGTLADDLQFKDARWQLTSDAGDGGEPAGLSFAGTLDTSNSLGFFIFLIGNTDEVLTGAVETLDDGVPGMRLTGDVRGSTDLSFISLGPVSLAVSTRAVSPVRDGGRNQASVLMEVSTSLDFTAQGQKRQIPLSAGIYQGSSSIRLDADVSQLVSAGLDELKALVNGVDLGGLSFGDFKLEDVITLTQLTFIVDPLASSKLTSAALTLKSAKSWDILTDADGKPFLSLQNIEVGLGIVSPFTASELSAMLRGEIVLDGGSITAEALLAPQDVRLQCHLDSMTRLSLSDLAAHFLGEKDAHTPEVYLNEFSLVVESGRNYSLSCDLTDLWAVELGENSLELKDIRADWQYAVGGETKASLSGTIQLGGTDINLLATYDKAGGWSFSGGLMPGQTVAIGDLLAELLYYFGVEPPAFVESIRLDTLDVDFNTTSKNFNFTIGGGLPVDDKWLGVQLTAAVENKDGDFELKLSGTLIVGGYEFTMAFAHDNTTNAFVAVYTHTAEQASITLRQFVADNLSASAAEVLPESLEVDIKTVLFAFSSTNAAQGTDGQTEDADGQAQGTDGQAQGADDGSSAPQSNGAQTKFLFGLDLSASISLSDLPLVGSKFPPEQTAGVNGLRLLVASEALTQPEAETFNGLLPDDVTRLSLPAPDTGQTQNGGAQKGDAAQTSASAQAVIGRGLTVSATMSFGGSPQALSLPVTSSAATNTSTQGGGAQTTSSSTVAASVTSSDNAKWFTLQKTFGPVSIQKVGVKYQDGSIWFLLSASLSAAGLTLSLDGLAVGSSVKKFSPEFDLRGLGIEYEGGGSVEIGGAFLRIPKEQSGKDYDEYDGAVLIKAGELKLSAIGSYAELGGHPSLFVYAVLDYPIGGPSFFFVTGLAAGFGYNRSLVVPAIDAVAQFPLVADAVNGAGLPSDVGQKVASLQQYIPPTVGEYFLAVGIKFNSFKLIDSFALLTVAFGTQFEVNLLGLSTLVVPTPIPGETFTPLAEVQLAVLATYNPAEGFLGVAAQLTSNSFLLSRDCHLTGGFAFYCWFGGEHKGDFVLSLGGYHPDYKVPDHYPRVPRLGFNWRVDDQFSIKGGSYYTLTAAALMAGCSLQATFDSGNLKAHFNASADFIIYWRPYHYDARAHVDIGVSYTYHFAGTHHLNVDVGADLHIWGPEFAGAAHIKLSIISFDISFGSSGGNSLQPINWDAFSESFLPKGKDNALEICGVSVADGLSGAPAKNADDNKGDGGDVKDGGAKDGDAVKIDWIINPKTFVLVTNSVIPSKDAYAGDQPFTLGDDVQTTFGIGPMAVTSGGVFSRHTVCVKRMSAEGEFDDPADADFKLTPIKKNVPVALWGESLTPALNGPAFIRDTLAGFEVRPTKEPTPGATEDIKRSLLQYETEPVADAYQWVAFLPFVAQDFGADEEAAEEKRSQAVLESINDGATADARRRLLGALGVADPVELSGYTAEDFLIPPQIEAVSS